jgi:MFS family permease
MSTAMSLISTNFPEDKEKYISYIGASMGFGLMIGPPLGSFVFGRFGFAWVFYFFSIWIFIMMIL